MKCPKCQAENPVGSEYCRKCGQSLLHEGICPKCGHTNFLDSVYCNKCGQPLTTTKVLSSAVPTSFANGRYQVKEFLGDGGKKKVDLVHDTVLDRDVTFALIKTEKLDETTRTRITREIQVMARLGYHPNIGTVYGIGEQEGQPFIVRPYIGGGSPG